MSEKVFWAHRRFIFNMDRIAGLMKLVTLITKKLWQEDDLDYIERMDHLTAIAEGRRNASLREIDRRRAILGETLRRSVQEIEADEFKVIEARPAQGKNAA
jgi:hypothetical protein